MNQRKLKALAVGAAIAGSLAAVSAAQANPFALTALGSAYLSAGDPGADAKAAEGKCGEGKCGAKMKEGEKKEGEKAKEPEKA
jgi:uncharacterized low-complexity protein